MGRGALVSLDHDPTAQASRTNKQIPFRTGHFASTELRLSNSLKLELASKSMAGATCRSACGMRRVSSTRSQGRAVCLVGSLKGAVIGSPRAFSGRIFLELADLRAATCTCVHSMPFGDTASICQWQGTPITLNWESTWQPETFSRQIVSIWFLERCNKYKEGWSLHVDPPPKKKDASLSCWLRKSTPSVPSLKIKGRPIPQSRRFREFAHSKCRVERSSKPSEGRSGKSWASRRLGIWGSNFNHQAQTAGSSFSP